MYFFQYPIHIGKKVNSNLILEIRKAYALKHMEVLLYINMNELSLVPKGEREDKYPQYALQTILSSIFCSKKMKKVALTACNHYDFERKSIALRVVKKIPAVCAHFAIF